MVKRYGKRIRIIGIVGLALFLALIGRLYYIQILCGQELAAGALGQQIIKVQSVNNRGTIYASPYRQRMQLLLSRGGRKVRRGIYSFDEEGAGRSGRLQRGGLYGI